jgi:DNA-binding NtrC family response regulator
MPARVVVVHDEPGFADQLAGALRLAGLDVATFVDPMVALDALEAASVIKVLITRVEFPPGKPNGVALARMTRIKRPDVRVVFTADPEFAAYADGLGVFVPAPINTGDVVDIVGRLLIAGGEASI